jgi:ubiquinone/menaquinone biosynthesis C-methylase UbiE
MSEQPVYTADEFDRESRYLERLVWEAIAVDPGCRVLICGYGTDGVPVRRAMEAGADVTVIEHRNDAIARFSKLGAKLVRGSTSVIPAKDGTFDLAISFHYLHEIDPFFHAQVVAELARVARRVAIVEPAPPADPLGKRIALLYSQAKRELGQFEYYQPLEYWKKLLQAVKADVSQRVFAFAKVPPREYLQDTVKLLLDTIEIEDAPRAYMDELRQIASRSDAQLLPPPRFVLVGAAAGELPTPIFSQRIVAAEVTAKPAAVGHPVTEISATAAAQEESARDVTPAPTFTFTPEPAPGFGAGMPFGVPPPVTPAPQTPPAAMPFGTPFAVPGEAQDDQPFGWEWEPPDEGDSAV